MLVVTRKKDEKLVIGENIEVQVLRIGRENVRLGIKAPADVSIYRYEIYEAIQSRERAARESGSGGEDVSPESSRPEDSPEAAEGDVDASATAARKARAQSEG